MISTSQENIIKQRNERMLQLARDGRPHSAIARELGCSNSTVSKELTKAGMGRYKPKGITLVARKAEVITKSPQLGASVENLLQFEQFQKFQEFLAWQKGQGSAAKPAVVEAQKPVVKPKAKTLIFTSWEIRVKHSGAFCDVLAQMKREYNAELYLSPVWPEDVKFMPPELEDQFTIASTEFEINDNLLFKYVPTHALVQSPIQGWTGAHPDKSVIIPGLVRDLVTEPSTRLSKQIMTTGSVGCLDASLVDYEFLEGKLQQDKVLRKTFNSRLDATMNRRGGRIFAVAQKFTKPTALIVDVLDDNTFFTRYIAMEEEGIVYDLNRKFTAGKKQSEASRPEALVMGDLHAADRDESTYQAGLEMIRELQPRCVVLNDAFDGDSCRKFERHDAATFLNAPTLEEEAAITRNALLEIAEIAESIAYIHSNHDDHLIEYLENENNYKLNRNYKKCLELQLYRINTGKHPIIELLGLETIPNLKFVSIKENLYFGKTLTKHGHEGISGRRVGAKPLIKVYNYYVDGHGHSPLVWRNGARVGTTSNLKPGYANGASGWLGADALIQPDNSVQLLPIIYGNWRLA